MTTSKSVRLSESGKPFVHRRDFHDAFSRLAAACKALKDINEDPEIIARMVKQVNDVKTDAEALNVFKSYVEFVY